MARRRVFRVARRRVFRVARRRVARRTSCRPARQRSHRVKPTAAGTGEVAALATAEGYVGPSRWLAGDVTADVQWSPDLEEGYRELAPALLGYFRSHRVDQPEDLVGDVFVSVARNLRAFHGDADDFRRWVFAIAHRRRVDHTRRWLVRRRVVFTEPPQPVTVDDRRTALDVDLLAALEGLTAIQREVVVLRFVADLPLDDVARILRRRRGAVKALQARALAQLARKLGGDEARGA
jgi:RNA polymerase sigma-70 factor (ECF subfamily)